MTTKKCIYCGKVFKKPLPVSTTRWKTRKFCCLQCRIDWRKKNEWKTLTCLLCGKKFRVWKYLNRKYCSLLCAGRSRPNRGGEIINKCQFCDKEFSPKIRGREGRKQKYCSTKCQGLACRGKNHWNWKGGISGNHRRETEEYKEWRLKVYRRDHFTCQDCKKHCPQGNIVAHHLKSWDEFPKLRFVVENGITLCRRCHKIRHQSEK